MAPIITTSLREYAMDKVREHERHTPSRSVQERDSWIALQDWTEDPETLYSFNEALDKLDALSRSLNAEWEQTTPDFARCVSVVAEAIADVEDIINDVEDCRYVITNIRRKDAK